MYSVYSVSRIERIACLDKAYSSAILLTAMKKQVNLRVDDKELAAWREAAYLRRKSLSEWIRTVLNATAESMKEKR